MICLISAVFFPLLMHFLLKLLNCEIISKFMLHANQSSVLILKSIWLDIKLDTPMSARLVIFFAFLLNAYICKKIVLSLFRSTLAHMNLIFIRVCIFFGTHIHTDTHTNHFASLIRASCWLITFSSSDQRERWETWTESIAHKQSITISTTYSALQNEVPEDTWAFRKVHLEIISTRSGWVLTLKLLTSVLSRSSCHYILKNKDSLFASMVSWRTFNIHGTFLLQKALYNRKRFIRFKKKKKKKMVLSKSCSLQSSLGVS